MTRVIWLLMGLFLFTGCIKHRETSKSDLYIGVGQAPTTLDPRFATDALSQRLCGLMFSSLVSYDNQLKLKPELARSWKQITPTEIEFEIRDDLQFQDGKPVTLQDVVFSIDEYRKDSSVFKSAFGIIQSIKAMGSSRFRLKLSRYNANLLYQLELLKILPKHIYDGKTNPLDSPLGSGPFRFSKSDTSEIVLEKSKFKTHQTAQSERLIFKIIRDENTRYLKSIKGDIDVFSNELPEDKVQQLLHNPKVKVLVTTGLNFNYLLINLRNPTFQNVEVRRAILSALNRDTIIKYKLEGLASLASSILAPVNPFSNTGLNFQKPSPQFQAPTETIRLTSSSQAASNAQIIAQQLTKAGFKVDFRSYDWGTYYSDVRAGKFEIALMRWVGIVDPDVYRDTLGSGEFPPGHNRGYYSNHTFDDLVLKASTEPSESKRKEMYFKAQQIIADDLPIIPLWYNSNIDVINAKVLDYTPHITGNFEPLIQAHK